MTFCQKILRELLTGRRHSAFNWPFLEPVDVEGLGIYDYYDIIKEPMDFSTMQNKMTAKQYASPEEFHADMMLVISNCLRYNPDGQPVNKCGKDLKEFFESKWDELPSDELSTPKPKSAPKPKATPKAKATPKPKAAPKTTPKTTLKTAPKTKKSVSPVPDVPQDFGKLDDSEELITLLSHVQDERKRVASQLDSLKQYEIQLTQLRYYREEAQNEGSAPPSLSNEFHTAIRNSLLTGLPPAFDVDTPGFSAKESRLASLRRERMIPASKVKVESQNSFEVESYQLKPKSHRNEPDCEYQFDSDEEGGPMTFEEKTSLTEAVAGFSDPRLDRVSKIIMKREKEFSSIEPQVLEIDFEELRPTTLREIEAYVKACNSKDNVGVQESDKMISVV